MGRIITLDKQNPNITYTGTWTLSAIANTKLGDASNVNNGSGSFGNNYNLCNTTRALIQGSDYTYDSRLDSTGGSNVDIYDDSNSGAFSSGKYMRVVEDGLNVTNTNYPTTAAGGLQVYAKNLSSLISPPKNQIYIDPYRGKFVLPRPSYWSKCESVANLTNAEITDGLYPPTYNNAGGHEFIQGDGKFGNCFTLNTYGDYLPSGVSSNLYIFGAGLTCPSKLTASFWALCGATASCWGVIYIFFGANDYIWIINSGGADKSVKLFLDGAEISSYVYDTSVTHHCYFLLDSSKGLSGGKSLRMFINGTERLSSTATLNALDCPVSIYMQVGSVGYPYWAWANIDNIKVWKEVVTEDPSFEYNSGTGRENALHDIYGSDNGYVPEITGTNNGVGFYNIVPGVSPVKLLETNYSGASAVWNNI